MKPESFTHTTMITPRRLSRGWRFDWRFGCSHGLAPRADAAAAAAAVAAYSKPETQQPPTF